MSWLAERPKLKRPLQIGGALYVLAIVGVILSVHPKLLDLDAVADPAYGPRRPPSASHKVFPFQSPQPQPTGGEVTSTYRGGPHRTGVDEASRLPLSLTETWRQGPINVGIHGANKGSPAVDASGIYVGADTSYLHAYDFDGHLRWRFYVAGSSHGIHGTPALDETRVYFGAYNGVMYALSKDNGEVAWATKLGDAVGSSPVIVGDDLYIAVETVKPPDGFVAKLNRHTGEVLWLSDWLGEQAHSSPVVNEEKGLVYVGANDQRFSALYADDGSFAWRFKADSDIKGTGLLVEDGVYFVTMRGKLLALDAESGKPRWRVTLAGRKNRLLGSPAWVPEVDALVAASADHLTCVDRKTGNVVWTRKTGVERMNMSPLVVRSVETDAWTVWMGCGRRKLCALEPQTGEPLLELPLGTVLSGVPVAFGASLFVSLNEGGSGAGTLVRFD